MGFGDVWGLGFGDACSLGFGDVWGLQGLGLGLQGPASSLGLAVSGLEFRVWGLCLLVLRFHSSLRMNMLSSFLLDGVYQTTEELQQQ